MAEIEMYTRDIIIYYLFVYEAEKCTVSVLSIRIDVCEKHDCSLIWFTKNLFSSSTILVIENMKLKL